MIDEYEHVLIKSTGITGEIVDIYWKNGIQYYVVESDEEGVPGGFGPEDSWKLFDCRLEDLERI